MRDLDCCQRLDVNSGMAFLESPEHVEVVIQPQLRMEPSHDVKFSRGIVTGGFRFLIDFIEGTRVRSLLFGQACKRAKDTRLSQDTHICGIDVLMLFSILYGVFSVLSVTR